MARTSLPTSLPMSHDEFVSWDDSRRSRVSGKILVPYAKQLASYMHEGIHNYPYGRGLSAKAEFGHVDIYEGNEVIAVISKREFGNDLYFVAESHEPDRRLNQLLRNRLEGARRIFLGR